MSDGDIIVENSFSIYISIGAALVAVIIALYYCTHLKNESEKHIQEMANGKNKLTKDDDKSEMETASEQECVQEDEDIPQKNFSYIDGENDEDEDVDSLRLNGLVGALKSRKLKKLEANLTEGQLEEEKRVEREQMAAILELLKRQETEFDEHELNAQLGLYR